MVVYSKLLFPTTSNNIIGKDAMLTKYIDYFDGIDWCKVIVDDLREAMRT